MAKLSRRNFIRSIGTAGTAALIVPQVFDSLPVRVPDHSPYGRKIRVGIIGCGSVMNCCYAPHLLTSPYAEIVSVCDIKPERAKAAAGKFKVANWYPHIDNMLAGV